MKARSAWDASDMTAKEVLETVAAMPCGDWLKIQTGIADLLAASFSEGERSEIREALTQAETEFAQGEGLSRAEMNRHFGL